VSFTLKDNQEATFQLVGTDAGGNDTPFTGTPKFSVDDPSILTLVDNGDGKGTVSAAGKVGTGTLSVTDAETDGQNFIGSVAIDVVAGPVTAISINLGTPTDKPAPTPAP
jgi:hypothetical protein